MSTRHQLRGPQATRLFLPLIVIAGLCAGLHSQTRHLDTITVVAFAKVYSLPDTRAPLIGLAPDARRLVVLAADPPWYRVPFGASSGWVRYVAPGDTTFGDEAELTQILADLAPPTRRLSPYAAPAGAALAMLVALFWWLAARRYRWRRPEIRRRTSVMRTATRVAIVASQPKLVACTAVGGVERSLDALMWGMGFHVSTHTGAERSLEGLAATGAQLLFVDADTARDSTPAVRQILERSPRLRESHVVMFNVDDPSNLPLQLSSAPRVLGRVFDDAALLREIAPALDSGSGTSAPSIALEGKLHNESMLEVFQLLEISRRSGQLTVDFEGEHMATVYFADGMVIHAASGEATGREAAREILHMTAGDFRFVPSKQTMVPGGSFAVSTLLMEHAKDIDEAARQTPPPSSPA